MMSLENQRCSSEGYQTSVHFSGGECGTASPDLHILLIPHSCHMGEWVTLHPKSLGGENQGQSGISV